ncbi:MAG: hypothetical protein ABW199_10590, partial [Caulobacterales bacterium]
GGISSGALGIDTRVTARPQLTLPQRAAANTNDSAEVSGAASTWSASRESIDDGLAALDLALAAGREALTRLNQIGERARNDQNAQVEIDAYVSGLNAAQSGLLFGDDLSVAAEPGAQALTIEGADFRIGGRISVPADASSISPADLAKAAQDGAAALQEHLTRLENASRELQAHSGFVSAAESAIGARSDLSADGARLLALQVRQGLDQSGLAIANAQPQAVLSLFRG